MKLTSGTRLGPYEIVAPLGAGGMGEVYRARDTRLDRTVAIKILPADFAEDARLKFRFAREAKMISALSHPHICTLHDIGREKDLDYLVMEYCEGKTLAERIDERPLPLDEVLTYGIQIADALDKAHRQGIIHRDLKPSNIILTRSGVKLLDFGLARNRVESSPGESTMRQLTQEGHILGTIEYMAPELFHGKQADAASDVFALGAVLYEMVTGSPAFSGPTPASVIAAIMGRDPRPVRELAPSSPAVIEDLIRACLAKNVDDRIQAAHDVAVYLRAADRRGPEGASRRALQRPHWRLTAIALTAGVAAGAVYLLLQRPPPLPRPVSFTRITSEPGVESEVSLSPDGKFVAYTSGGDIHARRVGGSRSINLTESERDDDRQPAFSPDGERIAFRSNRDGGGIFVMGATGESPRRLSDFGYSPSWSPEGKEIVVSTEGYWEPGIQLDPGELWTIHVETGEKRLVMQADATQPTWSPDGRRIAFMWRRGEADLTFDVGTVARDGGEPVAVTDDRSFDYRPNWSHDGKHLYFLSTRGGTSNVWRIAIDPETGRPSSPAEPLMLAARRVVALSASPDGRLLGFVTDETRRTILRAVIDPHEGAPARVERVIDTGMTVSRPAVSPNGQWVAFETLRHLDRSDIWVVRSDGTELRQITNDEHLDMYARWSPDSRRIDFTSDRGGKMDIWIVNLDGSGLRRLTDAAERVWNGNWSPDGTRLSAVTVAGGVIFDLERPHRPRAFPPYPETGARFTGYSWSPDGSSLAGKRAQPGGISAGIATYSFTTGKYELVTEFGDDAAWLPDGRRLLVARGNELWIVEVDSKESRKVYTHGSPIGGHGLSIARDGAIYFSASDPEANLDIWLAQLQ